MRRIVSWMILALFLLGTFTLAFNVGLVHAQAESTVYINSNGSVSPSDAPISSVDNVTYTFTGNISYPAYFGVVIERSNIVIDGNGYTVQGNYTTGQLVPKFGAYDNSLGLSLVDTSNVTIKNANIKGFHFGIVLRDSNNTVIKGNDVTANFYGIVLNSSPSDVVSGNSVTTNEHGIYLYSSSNDTVSGNNATLNSDGIDLYSSSDNNTVSGNSATLNIGYGIYLDHSSSNTVSGNSATLNNGDITVGISSNNNTVSGNDATGGVTGIWVNSYNNTVSGNNATANYYGIELDFSSNNIVSGNNVTANRYYGIYLYVSSNNTIYNNNFIGNVAQASADPASIGNTWDNGYPSGGNYWSDYNGTDLHSGLFQNVTGSDGIGDTPYVIDANNTDDYPLMGMFSDFSVAEGVDVQIVSNSTVSDFQFNGTAILFNVSGTNGTTGFCNVRIPTSLLNGTLTVLVNETQVQYSLLPSSNSTQTYLHFTYGHSTEHVIIMRARSVSQGITYIVPIVTAVVIVIAAIAFGVVAVVRRGRKRRPLDVPALSLYGRGLASAGDSKAHQTLKTL